MENIVQRFTVPSVLPPGLLISPSSMTANLRSGDADNYDAGVHVYVYAYTYTYDADEVDGDDT